MSEAERETPEDRLKRLRIRGWRRGTKEMDLLLGPYCDALAEGRARDLAAGRTLVGPHRDDLAATYLAKGMPARECSTGEQKALLISLILANGRAVAADGEGAPLLLLDEVAAHLDGDRRAALYDEICALGAQAFMSGTGPELFAELGTRAQAFELDRDGAVHEGSIG